MTKICAIQMDSLESINLLYDSSFAMGVEAQKRGYRIFHYLPQHITYSHDHRAKNGRVSAAGHFVTLDGDKTKKPYSPAITTHGMPMRTDHFHIDEAVADLPLDQCDIVFLRQDPPFNLAYITSCHLLEILEKTSKTLVINNPAEVRSNPEKLAVLEFSDLMPATIISNNPAQLQKFHKDIGDIVVKALYGHGGLGVMFFGKNDPNLSTYIEMNQAIEPHIPLMAQKFLPNVVKGDKRIMLCDGTALGSFNRTPKVGQVRANTHAGGGLEACELSKNDKYIVERLKPWIIKKNLFFVGIDVIDGYLTEINVTSPTGIPTADRLQKTNIIVDFWNRVEKKIAAKQKS